MSTRAERRAKAHRRLCPNCGKKGPHYVGPSFGDPGIYICNKWSEDETWFEHLATTLSEDAL